MNHYDGHDDNNDDNDNDRDDDVHDDDDDDDDDDNGSFLVGPTAVVFAASIAVRNLSASPPLLVFSVG